MDHSAHGSDQDARHEEVPCELELHLGQKHPLEAQIEAFAMHEVFEGLDVLDAIGTV